MPITHNPFVYPVGPLEIGGFGLAVLMAFVIAQITMQRELERRGHDPRPVGDMIIAAVVGGLVGAKVYYAILTGDWTTLYSRAGFVFWGGLFGGALAVWLVIRVKKLSTARMSEVSAIVLAAGHAIGRTGCWAVGDDYGRPWDGPLAVAFPRGAPPSTAGNLSELFGIDFPPGTDPMQVIAVHPTQLYETAALFAVFLILWKLRDHRHAEGWLFGVWAVLAGVERFLIEFLRAKDDLVFTNLTIAQLISLGFIVLGAVIMYARWNVTAGKPGIYAGQAVAR